MDDQLRPAAVGGVPGPHTPFTQSSATAHTPPSAQRVGQAEPQSTSLSVPFFTPSVQLGA